MGLHVRSSKSSSGCCGISRAVCGRKDDAIYIYMDLDALIFLEGI